MAKFRHDYTLRGIRTPAFIFPVSKKTSNLIVRKKTATCERIDRHYNARGNHGLVRKIFKTFMLKVIDIVVNEQKIFLFPYSTANIHYRYVPYDNEYGNLISQCYFDFSANRSKRGFNMIIPPEFRESAKINLAAGKRYSRLYKNFTK